MQTTRASLLLRIRNRGDATAWREFDTIYRPMLKRYARARGLDSSEADDVVQHCMTTIHTHIDRFDYDPTKGRFSSWLRTLVNNRVRTMLRSRHEAGALNENIVHEEDDRSMEEAFDKLWMDEHLRHALHLVSAEVEQKTLRAFEMYVIRERPIDEICVELEMNANQVHKAKHRLTKKLAEKMAELGVENW